MRFDPLDSVRRREESMECRVEVLERGLGDTRAIIDEDVHEE